MEQRGFIGIVAILVSVVVIGIAILILNPNIISKITPTANTQETNKPSKFTNLTPLPSQTNPFKSSAKPISTPIPTATPMPTSTTKIIPTPIPTSQNVPQITKKVLLLIFNPVIESKNNQKLTSLLGWSNPDDLTSTFISDISESSHNKVNYQISQRLEIDGYPAKSDGFTYDDSSYLACWYDHSKCHTPDIIDCQALLSKYGVCEKLNSGEIDELWLFGGPWFGYYEAVMAGPGAFFTNASPITGTSCNKKLSIMGFNYERGVAEMLEDMGHRTEGTMSYVYGEDPRFSSGNYSTPWGKFATSDHVDPGNAGCGWMHYAPNSQSDYDWANTRYVASNCDDWLNYPDMSNSTKMINCSEWNCDARQYKKWWFFHLPHSSGTTDGKYNNWWKYVVDTNNL